MRLSAAAIGAQEPLHKRLGVVVPDHMEEQSFDSVRRSGVGNARYKNFRRFDTDAQMVPPPD